MATRRALLARLGPWRWALCVPLALVAVTACGDDDAATDPTTGESAPAESEATEPSTEATGTAKESTEVAPVREGADGDSGSVSREEAEQAALDAVGEGRVTWSGPEDDRGAAWEVEVTRPDGSEVDVLVAADGSIVKQVDKFGSGPALEGPGPESSGGVVSQEEAEQAALDAVGEGEVTYVSREDERGAVWEIEITRPDGSEIDVLIAADGSVVN